MHDGIHLGADPDGFHDLDAESFDKVTRDDDLDDEAHAEVGIIEDAVLSKSAEL
jgi:hypothetical protein